MLSSEKLKVLGDRTRLAVMEYLLNQPGHVGDLAKALQVEQSLLSHHLRVLREAELVVAVRDGKAMLYRVAPGASSLTRKKAINLGDCQLLLDPEGGESDR